MYADMENAGVSTHECRRLVVSRGQSSLLVQLLTDVIDPGCLPLSQPYLSVQVQRCRFDQNYLGTSEYWIAHLPFLMSYRNTKA
jgi:hypothetical protein